MRQKRSNAYGYLFVKLVARDKGRAFKGNLPWPAAGRLLAAYHARIRVHFVSVRGEIYFENVLKNKQTGFCSFSSYKGAPARLVYPFRAVKEMVRRSPPHTRRAPLSTCRSRRPYCCIMLALTQKRKKTAQRKGFHASIRWHGSSTPPQGGAENGSITK